MRPRNINFIICEICIFILLGVSGCVPSAPTPEQGGKLPSPTVTLTSTPMPAQKPIEPTLAISTVPSIPTQQPEQTKLMKELLHAKDCSLPCYLGITPGKTTLKEGGAILKNLGAMYEGSYERKNDHAMEYAYSMAIEFSNKIRETLMLDNISKRIIHWVSLISTDDVVQNVEVILSTDKARREYHAYWSAYSMWNILLSQGVPDEIYFDHNDPGMTILGRSLILVYREAGIVIEVHGGREETNICIEPEYEANYLLLELSLYDPNSGVDIYADGRIPPTDREIWTPIGEELGINAAEFYRRVVDNPSVCFTPIEK